MPREPTEITKVICSINIRVTEEQKEMFKAIGGATWLRSHLNRQIRSEQIQLGLSPQSSLLKNQKK
jgi:hypothetical protein